jgi:hypothetical protein
MHRPGLFALALAVIVVAPAGAAARDLSTDRPDRTESPYSVPRGWLQIESDVVAHGEFGGTEKDQTGTSVMAFNAKYGITRRMDIQALFSPWVRVRTEVPGRADDVDDGTGQAGLRLKYNIAGNDTTGPAMALLPFAYVPTRGDAVFDAISWGMVAPVSIDLGGDRAMSAMAGAVRLNNAETWVIGSVSLGTPIAGGFAGFVEIYVARAGFDENALDDTTFDAGITYAPGPDWQLDTGVYYGITSSTEDWRVFVGASARFDLSAR